MTNLVRQCCGGGDLRLDFQFDSATPVLCCFSIVLHEDYERPFVTSLCECVAGKSCANQFLSTIAFGEHVNDPGHIYTDCTFKWTFTCVCVSRLAQCVPGCSPILALVRLVHRTDSRATQIGLPSLLCLCSSGGKGCDSLRQPHLWLPVGSTTTLRSVLFSVAFWPPLCISSTIRLSTETRD